MSTMGLYLRFVGQCFAHELHRNEFGWPLIKPRLPPVDALGAAEPIERGSVRPGI
jgi:hypothetical protein